MDPLAPSVAATTLQSIPLGVLVVDDQAVVREGVARLIACAPIAVRWISTAATGAEAIRAAVQLRPDVVVLDADLAGEDGLALIPQLAQRAAVLVLTSHGDSATRARARRLGACAFVEKHRPAAELLASLVDVGGIRTRGEKTPGPQGASSSIEVTATSAAPSSRAP